MSQGLIPKAMYYRCEWSSIAGVGVFRKRADQPNVFLIVTVALPKDEAISLADAIVELLTKRECDSVAASSGNKETK